MKRDLPVTICTECGAAGYNLRVADARCSKTVGALRCAGSNANAAKPSDWAECPNCQATGYSRNKLCSLCKGSGYQYTGLRDKAPA